MEFKFENILSALDEYGRTVQEFYQRNLIAADKRSTGNLINSVKTTVLYEGYEYLVTLELADYWKYLEEGLRGAKNSSSPYRAPAWKKSYPFILKWIKDKPVNAYPMRNGKIPKPTQLAAMISRSIEKNGTDAGRYMADSIQTANEVFMPKLIEALHKDLENFTISIFKPQQGETIEL